jgi:hypothetical protein
MRDLIARILAWMLGLPTPPGRQPKPGRHSAAYFAAQPEPEGAVASVAHDGPWRSPWSGPSAAEARAIFKAGEAAALDPVRRERFFATAWAERGYDYPYVASGVHQVDAVGAR